MTVPQVADELIVSRKTIWRAVWAGELAHVKIGRLVRIERSALEAYIAANRHDAPRITR